MPGLNRHSPAESCEMKLKDVAEIQIGYQHRDKGHPITTGSASTHRIIQIKDLDLEERFKNEVIERGGSVPYVWPNHLYQVTPAGDAERYLVSQGDVLFLSRGQRTCAVPIVQTLENTVASYYFYILRPDADRVDPEYLAWFINQPTTQACLERLQRGSHIKIIPKSAFEELEVVLPPLATQRAIVGLERLRQKEAYTMRRLVQARQRLVNGLALRAAQERHSTT
jgi:type I restriction modification DNA specificity protein